MRHNPKSDKVFLSGFQYKLGDKVVTNEDLQKENPTWIMSRTAERTGISARTIASEGTTALDMAECAVTNFFEETGIKAHTIDGDGLIFCTQTPDHLLPSNSSLLHGRLDLSERVISFDITHACSGYVYAVGIAKGLVQSGMAKNVLVVTGDTYSRLVHPQDRSVRAIFGDGAACCLVSLKAFKQPSLDIVDVEFWTEGSKADRFKITNGGARSPINNELDVQPDKNARVQSANHIQMDGLGLLSFFNSKLPAGVKSVLARNELTLENVDYFVFHQASKMAIDGIVRALKVNENKVVREFNQTGNLVSSSIPVALGKYFQGKTIKSGSVVVLCGFGVGLSWSVAILRSV